MAAGKKMEYSLLDSLDNFCITLFLLGSGSIHRINVSVQSIHRQYSQPSIRNSAVWQPSISSITKNFEYSLLDILDNFCVTHFLLGTGSIRP